MIEQAIAAAMAGRPVIIMDAEREKEADLVIPASFATPSSIAFMMNECRGLIYLALAPSIAERLDIKLQERRHVLPDETAFATSIDARYGITSGISAEDRATTISIAISPESSPENIKTPGHVFPIIANKAGLLGRQGHTEAAVDLAIFAGCPPAAVGCELLNDNGLLKQDQEIADFAAQHNFVLITLNELIEHKKKYG